MVNCTDRRTKSVVSSLRKQYVIFSKALHSSVAVVGAKACIFLLQACSDGVEVNAPGGAILSDRFCTLPSILKCCFDSTRTGV